MATWLDRVGDFFALDDEWVRPDGGITRRDVVFTLTTIAVSCLVLELMRGTGQLREVDLPWWQQWALTAVPCLFVLGRRRWPLISVTLASAAYWAVGMVDPMMASLLSTQIVYFVVVFAGVAWARNRRAMAALYVVLVAAMFFWLVWGFAAGQALSDLVDNADPDALVPGTVAGPVLLSLINILYFGGAVIGGQVAWRSARQRAGLEEQTATIRQQAEQLRENAIIEERLRIARELHDVVAHHVSAIGVQAAAARRVLDTDPDAAKGALGHIESGSRDAVGQMRSLLGTLRRGEDAAGAAGEQGGSSHAPQPSLVDIPELVASRDGMALEVLHQVIEEGEGDLERVPASIGHSLYRTAQEALTNVTRHSTARSARVIVRVGSAHAEVEVTDDGRPRPGTSGTGMGQLGIRERITSHHGSVEVGPRPLGGYRVRARIPLRPQETP